MTEGARLNLIYLAGLDYAASGYQNKTLRAIRHIRATLGSDSTFGAARETLELFQEHPTTKVLVDASNDADLVAKAVSEAAGVHEGVAVFEVNPESLELPDPEADPDAESVEDEVYSAAAYKTALALVVMSEGNPTVAFYRAAMLGRTTEDMEMYKEVMGAIVSVFPPVSLPS